VTNYDIIMVRRAWVAALATVMAERGSKVLVVERSTKFSDRVRGEAMHPWGVAEVHELGLWPTFKAAGAHELHYWRVTPPHISREIVKCCGLRAMITRRTAGLRDR
jgi:2-polyprenyl-6-methoxyphenol hydroxylase-like FAD-dependent oxidoreductase